MSGSGEPLIECKALSKRYKTGKLAEARALDGVDFVLRAGERVAVVGPSGSGKSTFLSILGLLDSQDSGSYRFQGRETATLRRGERAALRASAIGFVFQRHLLLPQLSLLENVMLPAIARGRAAPGALERAVSLLDKLGIGPLADRPGSELSGGESQRAAFARALVNRPALVLADEPTGQLDSRTARALADLMCQLNEEEGVALVVVTHSEDVARRAGRSRLLLDGRLEAEEGAP